MALSSPCQQSNDSPLSTDNPPLQPDGSDDDSPLRPDGSDDDPPLRPDGSDDDPPLWPEGADDDPPLRQDGADDDPPLRQDLFDDNSSIHPADQSELSDFEFPLEPEEDTIIDPETGQEEKDYYKLLKDVSKDWLLIEINHDVSKTATDAFWQLATKKLPELFEVKKLRNVQRKTPQFQQIRNTLQNKNTPEIKMQFGYIHKSTGEMSIEDDLHKAPISKYPASQYQKAYEIATVDVSKF